MLISSEIQFFLLSLITGIFICGTAAYLGTLALFKRMSLVICPLGHLALPGIALALIYNFNIYLGAFVFIILGIIFIWLFEIKTKLPIEALTAIVFTFCTAITFLFLPIEHFETALVGDIVGISLTETIIIIILCFFVFFITKKIYSKMILINISEDLAKIEKINIKKYNLFYLIAIAIVVTLGVKIVGGLLTAALIAIPACTARNLSKNLFQYIFLAVFFGVISAFLGILLFKFTGFSAGCLIIIISALLFLISMFFKKLF